MQDCLEEKRLWYNVVMKLEHKLKEWTLPRWKKELDKVFSQYIRHKYSKDGEVSCFTCGRRKPIKKMQNGHYISRMYLATRFDENNCRPQCYGCNVMHQGQAVDFRENLVKEIGEDKVQVMESKRHQVVKLTGIWYSEQIQQYKSALQLIQGTL